MIMGVAQIKGTELRVDFWNSVIGGDLAVVESEGYALVEDVTIIGNLKCEKNMDGGLNDFNRVGGSMVCEDLLDRR